MIEKLFCFRSPGNNPHENIAIEEELLYRTEKNACILYLWQNERSVILGRNQNAWKECRVETLSNDGGMLARRLSGGGAVYHDLGNLNFTFLLRKADYDVKRQTDVVLNAVRSLGINAERNGRNDITFRGRKFSGNAYYETGDYCYHHGTIMIAVDDAAMKKYLRPSAAKLKSKGVDSVESRVISLKEEVPSLTAEKTEEAVLSAFSKEFGNIRPEQIYPEDLDMESLLKRRKKFGSVEWVYGKASGFSDTFSFRGDRGEFYVELSTERGVIREMYVYSDSMDISLPEKMKNELTGVVYGSGEMEEILSRYGKSSKI